ncbi:short-chain dehydrogenase, putative [Paecilomyces variotii No. 5]|uniref:Short-chain dehydrogenase, putative n=1 Tax=Byssochlamys spectabilis (strain No. 5 / NBRC 109023) TaxID=1356009 RepID=V5FMV6_BYSSN|nr:short-chain dehydrogenase, putative [Paecilomyces variotii No. 5]
MASFKYINKLQGKRVVIFGGTSGMGYAVAEALVEHRAQLIISSSNREKLTRTVQRLRTSYPDIVKDDSDIITIPCDLSQTDVLEGNLRDLFRTASENGTKKIDHIVFTAGNPMNVAGGITGTDIDIVNSLMAVRVFAPTMIAKVIATSDYVNKSAATSFTMTSGTAHFRPRKTWSIVAMFSGALQGLVSGLAVDLAPIRVNVVNPGFVQTELASRLGVEALDQAKDATLTKKIAQPEDIAEAYLYLIKDASVDGTAITSDNGKLLS